MRMNDALVPSDAVIIGPLVSTNLISRSALLIAATRNDLAETRSPNSSSNHVPGVRGILGPCSGKPFAVCPLCHLCSPNLLDAQRSDPRLPNPRSRHLHLLGLAAACSIPSSVHVLEVVHRNPTQARQLMEATAG